MRPWPGGRSKLDTQMDTVLMREFASPSCTSPVSRRKEKVPGLGVEPRRARGPRDFKATGERQRTKDLVNSLPFPVSEESEECRRVRDGMRRSTSVCGVST